MQLKVRSARVNSETIQHDLMPAKLIQRKINKVLYSEAMKASELNPELRKPPKGETIQHYPKPANLHDSNENKQTLLQ